MTQTALDMAVIAGMAASALTGWVACLFATPTKKGAPNIIQPTHVRIRQGNDTCPVCYSDQVEGDSIDFEGDSEVTQRMECLDCEAEWLDAYTLTMRILNKKGTRP